MTTTPAALALALRQPGLSPTALRRVRSAARARCAREIPDLARWLLGLVEEAADSLATWQSWRSIAAAVGCRPALPGLGVAAGQLGAYVDRHGCRHDLVVELVRYLRDAAERERIEAPVGDREDLEAGEGAGEDWPRLRGA